MKASNGLAAATMPAVKSTCELDQMAEIEADSSSGSAPYPCLARDTGCAQHGDALQRKDEGRGGASRREMSEPRVKICLTRSIACAARATVRWGQVRRNAGEE